MGTLTASPEWFKAGRTIMVETKSVSHIPQIHVMLDCVYAAMLPCSSTWLHRVRERRQRENRAQSGRNCRGDAGDIQGVLRPVP